MHLIAININVLSFAPPSADVDINVLFISTVQGDYGTGKHTKILALSITDMVAEKRSALIGFHVRIGNGYVPSWKSKTMESNVGTQDFC